MMNGRTQARIAGLLYLIPMFCGPFSMMYVPGQILVPGDAAGTATRLVASEALFRLGLLSDAAIFLSEIALTAVLYTLFRPAGRTLALTATFARLAMTVLQGANLVPNLAAVQLVGGASYLAAFTPAQLNASTLLLLNVHGLGVHVWEIFFGLHCLAVGILVYRSGYFPKVFGVLMGIASIGYSLNGLGNLVAPGHASDFAAVVGLTALVGEVPFVFWLLFKGLNERRWTERSTAP
jgi:hypothetical protein